MMDGTGQQQTSMTSEGNNNGNGRRQWTETAKVDGLSDFGDEQRWTATMDSNGQADGDKYGRRQRWKWMETMDGDGDGGQRQRRQDGDGR